MSLEPWLTGVAGVGRQSMAWFWAPVLLWTVVGGGTWLVLTLARQTHPLTSYRLRQGLLLSLPATLIAAPWVPAFAGAPDMLKALPGSVVQQPIATRPVAMAPIDSLGLALSLVLGIVGVVTVVSFIRLLQQARRLHRISLLADRIGDPGVLGPLQELRIKLGVRRPVLLLGTSIRSIPLTFRGKTPWILIPTELCDAPDRLRAVLAHELIHVRRADAVWSLIERAVAAPFALHPFVWMLGRSICHYREASCDAEVVSTGAAEPSNYARLLLEMSRRTGPGHALAPGLFTRTSNLKTRLETMKKFLHTRPSPNLHRRSVVVSALLFVGIVGLGACGSTTTPPAAAAVDLAEAFTSRFGPMADETRDGALKRLDIQMTYLQERVEEVGADLRAAERVDEPLGHHVYRQYELLSNMYLERLETYETLKLERETEIRIGEGA